MDVRNEILSAHHSLIAGTTGSGKSVLLNSVICEGLKRDYDFWFIDLKRVELNQYKKTKNCLAYATEPEQAISLLDDIIDDMDEEYERMEARGVKETDRPHRYLVIDELADLVSTKGVLDKIVKIGRLGRAAHIHTIGATQDPSRSTLSAQLMQNITCAVALRCLTSIESRQIIGVDGAETLPMYGKGYISTYAGVRKVDIPLTPEEEINKVIDEHRAVSQAPAKFSKQTTLVKAGTDIPVDGGVYWQEDENNPCKLVTTVARSGQVTNQPLTENDKRMIYSLIKTGVVMVGLMAIALTPGLIESIISGILSVFLIVGFFFGRRRR